MIDLSVVVLPAPLRPSSVTTSPLRTSKSTPCRMCDSPYHAFRPETSRRTGATGSAWGPATAMAASAMCAAHIRFHDDRVLGDRLVVSFGDDTAAREYGYRIREVGDDTQVVLDHQHRSIRSDAFDQSGDAADI